MVFFVLRNAVLSEDVIKLVNLMTIGSTLLKMGRLTDRSGINL